MASASGVLDNFRKISTKIPDFVRLCVVTKTQDPSSLHPIISSGHNIFAENYVQEAVAKWQKIKETNPQIELCMIGHLQKNKTADAVRIFDTIETVDSLPLAEKIANECEKIGRKIKAYTQINISLEDAKSGIPPREALEFIQKSPLEISGIMCIESQQNQGLSFLAMHNIAREIQDQTGKKLILSMGMSSSFETAIKLGSSEVRVGSLIFGNRPK